MVVTYLSLKYCLLVVPEIIIWFIIDIIDNDLKDTDIVLRYTDINVYLDTICKPESKSSISLKYF